MPRREWHSIVLVRLALIVLMASAGIAIAQSDDFTVVEKEVNELHQAGRYAEAFEKQRSLVGRTEKAETTAAGKPGKKTASALGALAWHALFVRNFTEALAASERTRTLTPDLLWIEANRAHALLFLGRLEEARAIYLAYRGKKYAVVANRFWEDTVVEDFEALRAAGIDHTAYGEIIAALAINPAQSLEELVALSRQSMELQEGGQYAEALPIADKYVAAARKRFGEEHPAYAQAINDLAELHRIQRHYAEAEPLYKRTLAIDEKALGSEHPDVATDLNNLAVLYRLQGRYTKAEPLYKRALAIREKTLGPEHPDVGPSLNNLALLYRAQGRYAESAPLSKRALAINQKALGAEQNVAPDNDAATKVRTQLGHAGGINSVAISADGRLALSGVTRR